VEHCEICHAPRGQPDQPEAIGLPTYPKLDGDTLVEGHDPTTVLRIILEGAACPVTPNAKIGFSMPSFATLSDRDVADVATYIRNSWGNRASRVSPEDVLSLRGKINS